MHAAGWRVSVALPENGKGRYNGAANRGPLIRAGGASGKGGVIAPAQWPIIQLLGAFFRAK
jgi:hypothetical protein